MTFDEWWKDQSYNAPRSCYEAQREAWNAALHEAIKIADSHCREYTSDEADNIAYADGYTDAAAFIWQDITKIVKGDKQSAG